MKNANAHEQGSGPLNAYTNHLVCSGYGWEKGTSMLPKEKWSTVEGYVEYLRHMAAYVFAQEFVRNKSVLEIGCGTGFGANHLAKIASRIIATDIWHEGISLCQSQYGADGNLTFMVADGGRLPFADEQFDIILSFHVIEHMEPDQVRNFLLETKRVLKKGGVFLVSTPNSRTRLLPFQKPWNPTHKKEYTDRELVKLLGGVFKGVKVRGICSSVEIQDLERKRLKQTPFKVYVARPFYRMLLRHLPSPLRTRLQKFRQCFASKQPDFEPMAKENFMARFAVDDFRVDPGCPKDCRDLCGICTLEPD